MSDTPRTDQLEERFSREHPDDLSGAHIAALELSREIEGELNTCLANYYILMENMRQIEKIVGKAFYEIVDVAPQPCDSYVRGRDSDHCQRCGKGEFEHGQIY